ncbi:hypothetical protein C8E97_0830 [Saccharothrix australiensis]|uniref:Uncharacterized protein n=1 Tax=Saccharothrix australiensis TaxID=2072 RepID=A0A495VTW5_9PSEU|nr:hypothetical protein C8E97_0830 [Saccharothrix australiensis]
MERKASSPDGLATEDDLWARPRRGAVRKGEKRACHPRWPGLRAGHPGMTRSGEVCAGRVWAGGQVRSSTERTQVPLATKSKLPVAPASIREPYCCTSTLSNWSSFFGRTRV